MERVQDAYLIADGQRWWCCSFLRTTGYHWLWRQWRTLVKLVLVCVFLFLLMLYLETTKTMMKVWCAGGMDVLPSVFSCSFSVFLWAAASLHRWRRRNYWRRKRRDKGDGEGVLVGPSVFSSVYLLSFCSSLLCSSSSVCSLVFFPVLPVLSLLRRNSCCCCGVRWRPVWGYVDREGCFGCMEEMAERGEWPGGGLVLGALSLSRSCQKEMEMSGLSGRVRWGNRGRWLAMCKRRKGLWL